MNDQSRQDPPEDRPEVSESLQLDVSLHDGVWRATQPGVPVSGISQRSGYKAAINYLEFIDDTGGDREETS